LLMSCLVDLVDGCLIGLLVLLTGFGSIFFLRFVWVFHSTLLSSYVTSLLEVFYSFFSKIYFLLLIAISEIILL